MDKLEAWNDEFGIAGRLYIEHPEMQPAPWVVVTDPSGHTLHISLNGANVMSWTNAEGAQMLHVREDTPADDTPIMCAVPSGIAWAYHVQVHVSGMLETPLVHEDEHGESSPDIAVISSGEDVRLIIIRSLDL